MHELERDSKGILIESAPKEQKVVIRRENILIFRILILMKVILE